MDMTRSNRSRPWTVAGLTGLGVFLVIYWFFLKGYVSTGSSDQIVTKATAYLSGSSPVTGTVTFSQATKDGSVIVSGSLKGIDPLAKRGFHIHQYGDLSDGCTSTGAHYNPHGKNHGAPTDSERHVGDLGNIEADATGAATFVIEDSQISLNGPFSILGRAVVIHAGVDDLGRGGNPDSLKTGNAGGRAACGVIGVV